MAARPSWTFLLLLLMLSPGCDAAGRGPGARRAGDPSALLGRWVLQDGTGHLLELRPGGTGTFRGEPLTWTVDGPRLTMSDASGSDTTGWRIVGDRLILSGPFETEIVLAREPGGARTPASR